MPKGGRMKMVWHRGKNLAPMPRGMMPKQPIPHRPAMTATARPTDRQRWEEYLATAAPLPMEEMLTDLMVYGTTISTTSTDPAKAAPEMTLQQIKDLMAQFPEVLKQVPLKVTPEQMLQLQTLPTLELKARAAELASIMGLPVILIETDETSAQEIYLRMQETFLKVRLDTTA